LKSTGKHSTNTASLKKDWTVYIIRCDDDTLYTGVTTELERRFQEHLDHPRGAKYFNGRKPLEVVYSENGHTRSSACQREAAIKKLSRDEKMRLIAACRN
jgi:putative endonuclease